MHKTEIKTFIFTVFMAAFFVCHMAYGNVGVNIVVVNPSDSKTQDVEVNYELPPGLAREDIVDTGVLEAEYDVDRGIFRVKGSIALKPKETRTLRVVVRDIWNIPEEKFEDLSTMLTGKLSSVIGRADRDMIDIVEGSIRARMEAVRRYQQDHRGDVQSRMEMHSHNLDQIRRVEDDIFSLDRLVRGEEGEARTEGAVTLNIEAVNPSSERKVLPIRYDLPREVRPHNIEDAGGMEVRHDVSRDIFYLYAEQPFGPEETRRFSVRIENVWRIPEEEIDAHVTEAEGLFAKILGTPEEVTAKVLMDSIYRNAELIKQTQSAAESVRDRVSAFRENQIRMRRIKDDIARLRTLLWEEEEDEDIKIEIPQELTPEQLWRLIMLIISFAMILTAVFYSIWIVRVKKDSSKKYDKVE